MMIDWGKLEWNWNSLLFSLYYTSTFNRATEAQTWIDEKEENESRRRMAEKVISISLVACCYHLCHRLSTKHDVFCVNRTLGDSVSGVQKFIRKAEWEWFSVLKLNLHFCCLTELPHNRHTLNTVTRVTTQLLISSRELPPTIVQRRKQSTPKALCFNSGSFPSPSALPRLNIIFRVYRWWKLFAALCQGE